MSKAKKIAVRSLAALSVAGPAGILAGAAQAYDDADCDRMFASANVQRVQSFAMEEGETDFGDDLHLFGAPLGRAVICWSIDGRAAVKGKLYSDEFREPHQAIVEIRFRRTNGQPTNITTRSVSTQGGFVGSREVEKVSPVGRFNEVRIQLKSFRDTALGPVTSTLATRTFTR
jgi:hypothetical protein